MINLSGHEVPPDTSAVENAPVDELSRSRLELSTAVEALRRSEALRDEAAAREAALENELQHRGRNLLATIRTVFARTMETAETLQEATDHFSGRLDALGRYQGLLARRPHATVDFETLVRDELLTFGFGDGDRVALDGPSVRLTHRLAEPIGLAVHELATNSVKFGALSARDGQLSVTWTAAAQGAAEPEPGLAIEWAETGVPVVASAPLRNGFGRDYIEFGLPYQLDAVTSFELRPGGLLCRIALSQEWLA